MGNYPRIAPGEEVFPEMQGYKMACCDCGLVHSLSFRVVKVESTSADGLHTTVEPDDADSLRVVLTAERDDLATKQVRESASPGKGKARLSREPWPLWRNRWVSDRTSRICEVDCLSYEMARAQAESEAIEYEAQFNAANERIAALKE